MSTYGTIELESYRLAAYTVPCPCYICGGGNNFDAELCRHCHAPMALAHQANSQKIRPRSIAVIGGSGCGKTVYLGLLTDMLSRREDNLQLLARGAFSIELQQHTMAALSQCEFPRKTPVEPGRWHWIHCQVLRKRRKATELIMPDLSGESLLTEVDHPQTFPVISAFLTKCSAAMILVDAPLAQAGDSDEDFHTMKLVSYLCELHQNKTAAWHTRPVAFIFTKADECDECFADPAAFASRHTPGLVQQAKKRLGNHRYFAVGISGDTATRNEHHSRVKVPLRVEPRGIVEPFQWMLDQMGSG
jgi:hypothetical protein